MQPNDSYTLGVHAIVMSAAGRHDEALGFAQQSAAINPSSADGWLAMSSIYRVQNCQDEMVAAAAQATSIEPDRVDALITYGLALLQRLESSTVAGSDPGPELAAVVDLARRALLIENNSAEAFTLLARATASGGDLERADELVSRALTIDPQLPRAHIVQAHIHFAQGRTREGLNQLMLVASSGTDLSNTTREALLDTSVRPAFARLAIFYTLVMLAALGGGWWMLLLVPAFPIGISGGMIFMARRHFLDAPSRRARKLARSVI